MASSKLVLDKIQNGSSASAMYPERQDARHRETRAERGWALEDKSQKRTKQAGTRHH